jgi:hypothetical protein
MEANPQDHEILAANFKADNTDVPLLYFKAKQLVAWCNVLIRFAGWIARNPGKGLAQVDRLFDIVFNFYRRELDLAIVGCFPLFLRVPEFFDLDDNSSFFTWMIFKIREILVPAPKNIRQTVWFHDDISAPLLFYSTASHLLLPFVGLRSMMRLAFNNNHKVSTPREYNTLQQAVVKIMNEKYIEKMSLELFNNGWSRLEALNEYKIIKDLADESVTDLDFEKSFFKPLAWVDRSTFNPEEYDLQIPSVKSGDQDVPKVIFKQPPSVIKKQEKKAKKAKKATKGKKKTNKFKPKPAAELKIPLTFNFPSSIYVEVTDDLPKEYVKSIEKTAARDMDKSGDSVGSVKARLFYAEGRVFALTARNGKPAPVNNIMEKVGKKKDGDDAGIEKAEIISKEEKEDKIEMEQPKILEEKSEAAVSAIPEDEIRSEKAKGKEEEEDDESSESSYEDEEKKEREHFALEKKKQAQLQKVIRQEKKIDQEKSKLCDRIRNRIRQAFSSSSSSSKAAPAETGVARLGSKELCLHFSDAYNLFLSNKDICSANARSYRWFFDQDVAIEQKHMDFLCALFNMKSARRLLTFKNMAKVHWIIEKQLTESKGKAAPSPKSNVFGWSHQFQINNVLVSPAKKEVHPEHKSSDFNHTQARALFDCGGFDPRLFIADYS